MNTSEYDHQKAVINWSLVKSGQYPELRLLNGSLNGVRLTIGQAVKAKSGGMKKGYPDLFLPVPRGLYHGLFIELKPEWRGIKKKVRPKPDKDQEWWLKTLSDYGYAAYCCRGADAAITVIQDYLNQ